MGQHRDIIVLIDDASGVTQSSRPWLEQMLEVVTVLAATDPAPSRKRVLNASGRGLMRWR